MNQKVLIIILAALILLGGVAAGAYFLFGGSPETDEQGDEAKAAGPAGLVQLETFLVNVTDASGERFARLDLRFTVIPAGLAGKINENELVQAKMRDRILTLLTGKSYEQLSTPVGKEGFRREVKSVIAPLIENGEIQEVLFTDFVVQ